MRGKRIDTTLDGKRENAIEARHEGKEAGAAHVHFSAPSERFRLRYVPGLSSANADLAARGTR